MWLQPPLAWQAPAAPRSPALGPANTPKPCSGGPQHPETLFHAPPAPQNLAIGPPAAPQTPVPDPPSTPKPGSRSPPAPQSRVPCPPSPAPDPFTPSKPCSAAPSQRTPPPHGTASSLFPRSAARDFPPPSLCGCAYANQGVGRGYVNREGSRWGVTRPERDAAAAGGECGDRSRSRSRSRGGRGWDDRLGSGPPGPLPRPLVGLAGDRDDSRGWARPGKEAPLGCRQPSVRQQG